MTKNSRTVIATLAVAICSMVCMSVYAVAQIPSTVALQGQLFQDNGSPLPDGNYSVSVSFHDGINGKATTVCDGCTVTFINGVFQVVLGDEDSPLPTMDRQYWVSISVNGEELRPRLALHSAPYARTSATAEYTPGTVPVGALVPYAGTIVEDENFLPADGRSLSADDYPELYASLGIRWGNGDESGDFNIPDTRGAFMRGSVPESALVTFSDPLHKNKLRLENAATGSVYDQSVVSTNELVQQLPQVSVMYLIRVR